MIFAKKLHFFLFFTVITNFCIHGGHSEENQEGSNVCVYMCIHVYISLVLMFQFQLTKQHNN